MIGKTSFDERALLENYAAVIDELVRAKPSAAKGRYIRSITLASTMGPGVKVDPTRTRDILEEAAPRRRVARLEPPKTSGGRAPRRAALPEAPDEEAHEPRTESSGGRRDRRPDPGVRRGLRRRLPRHHRAAGRRRAHALRDADATLPRRQEHAHRARRRRGRRRGAEGAARGPDRADVRARRRRRGRQGDRDVQPRDAAARRSRAA